MVQTADNIRASISSLDEAVKLKQKAIDEGKARQATLMRSVASLEQNFKQQQIEMDNLGQQQAQLKDLEQNATKLEEEMRQNTLP